MDTNKVRRCFWNVVIVILMVITFGMSEGIKSAEWMFSITALLFIVLLARIIGK